MRLLLDPDAALPLYRQVADALRATIAAGRLAPEAELPSVRDLAADNGVNYHTIARAYQELEEAGLLIRQRGGPFRVRAGARPEAGEQKIRSGLQSLAREALSLGLEPTTLGPWWEEALAAAGALATDQKEAT